MTSPVDKEFPELHKDVNMALQEAVARSAAGSEEWDNKKMWNAFSKKRDAFVGTPGAREPKASRRRPWLQYAITMVAAIAVIVVGIKYIPTKTSLPQSKIYTTTPGQRATITLADGSRVILAPASRMKVSSAFHKSDRMVELDGEAYFSVTTSTGAPFIVRADNQDTRVLGTSFAVRKYSLDKNPLRVIVAEGRVQVAGNVVGAGQGVVAASNGVTMLNDNEISAGLAWTDGRLVFVNAPVGEVITQIERWYDVKFVGVDSVLAVSRFSTTLQGNVLTDGMLKSLGVALGRRMERRGREINISR